MSDLEDNYDEDDDKYIDGHPIEELNDIKDNKRGIMLAEREVDNYLCCLCGTIFQQKGYDRSTIQRAARIMVEDEENSNEATGSD